MSSDRVGFGFDAHRLTTRADQAHGVLLGGIEVDPSQSVIATSDGDVLIHAICDALLGACALGDLGELFPSNDPTWVDADSLHLLDVVVRTIGGAGYGAKHIDSTVVAERVKVAPFRSEIRARLSSALEIDLASVSVKATTTDGMGFLGRGEGIAALAVATVAPI